MAVTVAVNVTALERKRKPSEEVKEIAGVACVPIPLNKIV